MKKILLVTAAALGLSLLAFPSPAQAGPPGATVVSPSLPLNVRTGPAVWNPRARTLPNGSRVAVVCQVHGQRITVGSTRQTDMWDRLADGTYVSDAWIRRSAALPACSSTAAATAGTAAVRTTPATVTSGATPLKARVAPEHGAQLIGAFPSGTALTLVCQQSGQSISGDVRTTNMWDRLGNGTYVSDAYVSRTATPPVCAGSGPAPVNVAAPVNTAKWVHPLPGFPASHSFRTPQNPNHIGVDIMSFTGTPIRAASAGRVLEVVCNIQAGGSCDRTGSAAMRGCGWYVKILHTGNIATIYCHMVRKGIVTPGQQVQAGQVIGYVGSSGNSSAPHLHFEVHVNAPPTGPQNAIDPIPFMRAHGVVLDKR